MGRPKNTAGTRVQSLMQLIMPTPSTLRVLMVAHTTLLPSQSPHTHHTPAPKATADATQNANHSNRCSFWGSCVVSTCSSRSCSSCMVVIDSALTNCRWGGVAAAGASTSCSCTLSGADRSSIERAPCCDSWRCCPASLLAVLQRVNTRCCCCGCGEHLGSRACDTQLVPNCLF